MKRLINITGLPGSGKTTFAALLAQEMGGETFAADDYFVGQDGTYQFRADELWKAHKHCQDRVRDALISDEDQTVIVHNTGRTWSERQVYRDIAQTCGAEYTEIYINTNLSADELAARNQHGVPASTIGRMHKGWQHA